MVTMPLTALYFVEMVIVLLTVDCVTLLQHKKIYILELICQGVAATAFIKNFTHASDEQYHRCWWYAESVSTMSFSFLLRNFRLCILLEEVKSFKVIMEMVMKMTVPILYQMASLYIVFYIFAIVGIYGLGGMIRQPNFHSEDGIPNNLYYLINFNDLASSIVTLFSFMIVNNWNTINDIMV
jgi:hypothetical protein